MRCEICDWSDDPRVSSDFSTGVHRVPYLGTGHNKVKYVKGRPMCTSCRTSIQEALREFDED